MPKHGHRWIALLGKRDEPTDALEDYCRRLAAALQPKAYVLDLLRIEWAKHGWRRALRQARKQITDLPAEWALVQYTGLSWSRRGFPIGLVRLIRCLKNAGMRVAIVFHDPDAFAGHRWRDHFRRHVQLTVMRRSARLADKIVSTISPDHVSWMKAGAIRAKTSVVPIGSNLPFCTKHKKLDEQNVPGIIVFGFSELDSEAALIARVLLRAADALGRMRLTIFGRGAMVAEPLLRASLNSSRVDLEVFGIVPEGEAAALLAGADIQLFVRSGLSSRRGSAIAGIVCGLPIVGFYSGETAFPITEAGVRLVPMGDVEGLIREIICVLQDDVLRDNLRARSLKAAQQYFSWEHIADQYISAIGTTKAAASHG